MLIIRSHKIRLKPTEDQRQHLFRAFAASRHAWNFGKEILDCEYDINRISYRETGQNYPFTSITTNNKITGQKSIKALYNRIKPDWIKDKTASATQEAFADLQRGLQRYFDIRKGKIKINGSNGKPRKDYRHDGWLNWRSKKFHNSFRATNICGHIKNLKLGDTEICYNVSIGHIKMCEPLRFDGKIMNVTFSYDGQWFWASIQVQMEVAGVQPSNEIVGVDLGIKYLAVTSDGEIIENPKAYYTLQAKLNRLQRKLDRQRRANNPDCYNENGTFKTGKRPTNLSNQMKQTLAKIKKLHTRIKNLRRNAQHHLTAKLAKNYGLIVVEDLNVSGMLKNHKLAKAIADAGFYEIRRQLEYKSEETNAVVGIVNRWFPSSKLCSNCETKKLDLNLSDRDWICENCGQQNERDLNAALNLKKEGMRVFAGKSAGD
jgi:putative transposase